MGYYHTNLLQGNNVQYKGGAAFFKPRNVYP